MIVFHAPNGDAQRVSAWSLSAKPLMTLEKSTWLDAMNRRTPCVSESSSKEDRGERMRTEKEKMLAGELYTPLDEDLTRERERAQQLLHDYNTTLQTQGTQRSELLAQLLGRASASLTIQPPFHCDYGANIHFGEGCFVNMNCVILDVCRVQIGDHVLLGPAVQIYTAAHPLDFQLRREKEFGKAVSIGDDVWIGGGAIICPGVTVGPRTVIGAGSVVTHDLPADVMAAGNPCRIIKSLKENDLHC